MVVSAVEVADVPAHDPELRWMRGYFVAPGTHDELREADVIAPVRARVQSPG